MARTRKKGNPIVSAVVFGIFGIVLLFLGIRTFIGLHGKLLNVTTCDESEVKPGVYVEGTLTYGYGAYVEKTTTYNHTVTKTDGYYYLVDICDKNEDGSKRDTSKWIGISISKSDDAKFDAISSADDAEPVYITGVIRKNSDKVQGFLDDYITKYVDAYAQYYGYTPTSEDYATAKAEAFPYYIEMVDSSDYIFKLVLGAVFLLAAVIMILKATRSKNTISAQVTMTVQAISTACTLRAAQAAQITATIHSSMAVQTVAAIHSSTALQTVAATALQNRHRHRRRLTVIRSTHSNRQLQSRMPTHLILIQQQAQLHLPLPSVSRKMSNN